MNRIKYKVLFKLSLTRIRSVLSGYRPDWCSDSKPEHNCATLSFEDIEKIKPGEEHECILEPLSPEFWDEVKKDDILRCMEGARQVAEAVVLEIIK